MLAVPLQFSCSPVQMRTVVFYHVCHVIYHLCKDASSKFTGKSEIFSDFYFFPTHPYENLNALWHWKLQSGTAVTSKMVWTLFSASPWQRTSCLLTQCKKPSTKDGIGGFGHRGKKVVPSTTSRDGGNKSGRWKSMSDAFKTQTVMKSYRVPASSGRMWNKRMQKSQWLSIGKWLSHASSLAGRGAVWNGESKGLNPDRGLPH